MLCRRYGATLDLRFGRSTPSVDQLTSGEQALPLKAPWRGRRDWAPASPLPERKSDAPLCRHFFTISDRAPQAPKSSTKGGSMIKNFILTMRGRLAGIASFAGSAVAAVYDDKEALAGL